jgi:enediyne polyketide synthase
MCSVHAKERERQGDLFVYDLTLTSSDGTILERWDGLRLKKVEELDTAGPWRPSLFGAYLERRVQENLPEHRLTVLLRRDSGSDPKARTASALREALGGDLSIHYRPDGKPQLSTDTAVSAAHAEGWTLAVAGGPQEGLLGCDLESVENRPLSLWRNLIGPQRFVLAEMLSREASEDIQHAATRVWCVTECLKKAGCAPDALLTYEGREADGWIRLRSGRLRVLSHVATLEGMNRPITLAILVSSHETSL